MATARTWGLSGRGDLNVNTDKDSRAKIISLCRLANKRSSERGRFTDCGRLCRYYFTPVSLRKKGMLENNLSWKYRMHGGSFIHAVRFCSLAVPFCGEIINFYRSSASWGTGRVYHRSQGQHLLLSPMRLYFSCLGLYSETVKAKLDLTI